MKVKSTEILWVRDDWCELYNTEEGYFIRKSYGITAISDEKAIIIRKQSEEWSPKKST